MAVAGHSMSPTLRDGDLLVYTTLGATRAGDLVVARDPDEPSRWLVKRVRLIDARGIDLGADLPGHDEGWVPRANLVGRIVFRYWPAARFGPVSASRRNT